MKLLPLLFTPLFLFAEFLHLDDLVNNKLVVATKQLEFSKFPNSFNPSLIKVEEGYLLTFRYIPDLYYYPGLSYIGIVLLDESFDPLSPPELLATRLKQSKTPSQSE